MVYHGSSGIHSARECRIKAFVASEILSPCSFGAVAMLCISSTHPQGFIFPRKRLAFSPFSKGHGVKRQSLLSLSADSEILFASISAGKFLRSPSETLSPHSLGVVVMLCVSSTHPYSFICHRQRHTASPSPGGLKCEAQCLKNGTDKSPIFL